jgi:peptidoglycan/xylan/chitin deacetylase (PgdA/CDA1 family)
MEVKMSGESVVAVRWLHAAQTKAASLPTDHRSRPLGLVAPITASSQGRTVVSLTFDDGWANNYETRSTLAAHGMTGA